MTGPATAADRVALALVWSVMSGYREGTRALLAGLDCTDPGEACPLDVCASLAALGAAVLDEAGACAEDIAELQREAGLG